MRNKNDKICTGVQKNFKNVHKKKIVPYKKKN